MIIVPVDLDPKTGTPIVPDEIKRRVRNGERISIEILPQVNGFAKNAIRHGVAGLNVDASRIPSEPIPTFKASHTGRFIERGDNVKIARTGETTTQGRWPSNVLLDEESAALLDEMSGELSASSTTRRHRNGPKFNGKYNGGKPGVNPNITNSADGYGDTGGAARFFKVIKYDEDTGVTAVADNDTFMYNSIQEVSLCNEIASIAESLLTHDRQMSHGDLADFAAENVKPPTNLSLGIIGTISDQTKADGTSNGESLEAERYIQNGAPSGSGSKPTGRSPKDMKSIILTATKLMTVLKTSKLSQDGNTRNYTARLEQTIESLTELSNAAVNDAKNTSRLQSSLSELLALTTAIASHAAASLLQNGASKTENTTTPTSENIVSNTNDVLRFAYVAKASKRDRDEGLEGMPERVGVKQFNEGMEGKLRSNGTVIKEAATFRNFHPTVKPTQLMRYLVRLVTPPGGTVLDPFLGSGSTLKAAKLEGFNGVGIELDAEYLEIAQRRIDAVQPEQAQLPMPFVTEAAG